ncbi:hypothetical protein D3C71_1414320 [compost metagenome]
MNLQEPLCCHMVLRAVGHFPPDRRADAVVLTEEERRRSVAPDQGSFRDETLQESDLLRSEVHSNARAGKEV